MYHFCRGQEQDYPLDQGGSYCGMPEIEQLCPYKEINTIYRAVLGSGGPTAVCLELLTRTNAN